MMDPELIRHMQEMAARGGALLDEFASMTEAQRSKIMPDLIALRDSQKHVLEHFAAVREAQNVFSEEEDDGE